MPERSFRSITSNRSHSSCFATVSAMRRVFTLRELVAYTAQQIGVKKSIIGLNDNISQVQSHILGLLPGKPFSYDNYLSLQIDNVCEKNGLLELGITPTDVDAVVPYYLGQRSAKERYCKFRCQA